MTDRIVMADEGSGRYHISLSTLVDVIKRSDKEYLDSFEGAPGLAGQLDTSLETGLSQDEAADNYSARIAVYVVDGLRHQESFRSELRLVVSVDDGCDLLADFWSVTKTDTLFCALFALKAY